MKLLDTSVVIDFLRGKGAAIRLLTGLAEGHEPLLASEVTRFELLAGVRAGEEASLERFFTAIEWVPVGESICRLAGDLARKFRPSHSGIDMADYLIAATSMLADADLLTTNVRHFPMIEGLAPAY
ncbi:MAG TPA: type II toxin-antitoxin system VapC family toxin [Solirubrobacterales bacterium]|nr:type II toxin-antitoxin system VapC family toxin [Solirubrobacterales bacterium]HMU26181.1 type II toxin-antitoxin system VapC family toxin [Solirubrobacterales bacterium]HMX70292.1 type II toxin-antitoxin system VapC family toxin [Solirubrobacterales bacterium]HMY25807.1 type II toxin-antitoxin system VapC family toxin [Solirubrobacterales bacterium]HNA23659.1 type II toxin-antitoxin system VapC family toxin [Solirubrobacterales bacterium]